MPREDRKSVEEHYRPDKVAELLGGIHVTTVLRLIDQGTASHGRRGLWPAYRPSRRVTLIPASAVHRYLAQCRA